jgi:outer membrane receptor for Fe3+-dicitrate
MASRKNGGFDGKLIYKWWIFRNNMSDYQRVNMEPSFDVHFKLPKLRSSEFTTTHRFLWKQATLSTLDFDV